MFRLTVSQGIITDLFPTVQAPPDDQAVLQQAIEQQLTVREAKPFCFLCRFLCRCCVLLP